MVRVSQAMPGGEMVRTYLSRGEYFGESDYCARSNGSRPATALDAADVVKIPGTEFNLMLEQFPACARRSSPSPTRAWRLPAAGSLRPACGSTII